MTHPDLVVGRIVHVEATHFARPSGPRPEAACLAAIVTARLEASFDLTSFVPASSPLARTHAPYLDALMPLDSPDWHWATECPRKSNG